MAGRRGLRAAEGREGSEAPGHTPGSRLAQAFSSTSKPNPGGVHSWSLVPARPVVRRNLEPPATATSMALAGEQEPGPAVQASRPLPPPGHIAPVSGPIKGPCQEDWFASSWPGWSCLVLLICKMGTLGCSGISACIRAAVTNYHRFRGFLRNLFCESSEGQISKMGLTGLKSRCGQGWSFWKLQGEQFPAFSSF